MTDYDDYDNDLAFPPQGDWADTSPRANTDRTASTIELVNKIEEMTKWLDLKSGYIEKLEKKLDIAKEYLKERADKDKYADWALSRIEEL